MLRKDFKSLLSQLESLTHLQRQKLLKLVKENASCESIALIESCFEDTRTCPYCEGTSFSRWGKSHGLQRYRCNDCQKTFNALTGTPLSRLRHKDRWLLYSDCLNEGMSVRKAADTCHIDTSTSFRWRHRFLVKSTENKSQKMVGIVEADETFFTQSYKGNKHLMYRPARKRGRSSKKSRGERVPVLIVRDRNSTVSDAVFRQVEKEAIHDYLRPLMSDEVVLCSDGNSIYQTFAKQAHIPHKRIIRSDNQHVVDGIFHIQNLNAYISRLKSWMVRFHGVATKYLPNYLGWRRMLEQQKGKHSNVFCLQHALM